jgi:RNA polymerase sigma-70 factor (ECF subfamily)
MDASGESNVALPAADVDIYYEQLVSLYWYQLRSFIIRRVGNPQDAEDIVQEALLRAYVALERYSAQRRQTLKMRAWLYKIAWNVYCNYTGRSKQPPSIPLDLSDESPLLEREDDRFIQPEAAFEHLEDREELERLVATLPQHYRDVVSLYYFEELNYQEVADILNQPVGTVKVYVHRGIRLLRKALAAQTNEVR